MNSLNDAAKFHRIGPSFISIMETPSMRQNKLFSSLCVVTALACGGLHARAVDTKPTNTSPSFMPTAQDLTDPAAPASPDAKTQEIKDSRWVQPGQLKSATKANAAGARSKISLTTSCT